MGGGIYNKIYHWIIVDASSMLEDTQINSLQSELDKYDDIKMTGRYMEPNNDIIKACLNQINNTAQQLLEHWRN